MAYSPGSHARLTEYDLPRFPGDTLLDRLGRAVSRAGCLPRKELYEAWEVARRARRLFRGGRVVDLGGGHGLLAQVMLLLDDSSPSAIVVDRSFPPSATKVLDALLAEWPRLSGRVTFQQGLAEDAELSATDVVVSSHACGRLTDIVLDRAVAVGARVAVLPCCHDASHPAAADLAGWLDAPLAIDASRALAVRGRGYMIRTQTIPSSVTPKNRLLLAWPDLHRQNEP